MDAVDTVDTASATGALGLCQAVGSSGDCGHAWHKGCQVAIAVGRAVVDGDVDVDVPRGPCQSRVSRMSGPPVIVTVVAPTAAKRKSDD